MSSSEISSDEESYDSDLSFTEAQFENEQVNEIINKALSTGVIEMSHDPPSLKFVKEILQKCEGKAKEFNWNSSDDLNSTDFMEILKLLSNFTAIRLSIVTFKLSNPRKKPKFDFKLRNLKILKISSEQIEFFEFFSQFLVENSLVELSIDFTPRYDSSKRILEKVFKNFLENQKSIKKLETLLRSTRVENIFKNGIKFLDLDELKISFDVEEIMEKVIESQKNLKKLTVDSIEFDLKILEELSSLKSLNFECEKIRESIKSFKSLEKLKIEEISFDFQVASFEFYEKFRDVKIDSLKIFKLNVSVREANYDTPDFFLDISRNFPNLKELQIDLSQQKLNFYAKNFKKLEKLSLKFDEIFLFCELDTGIVHENLRELKLNLFGLFPYENEKLEDFLEIFEVLNIFPNIENLTIVQEDSECLKISKKFIQKLLKLPRLKILQLSSAFYVNCLEIVDELKLLAEKVESIKIYLHEFNCREFFSEDEIETELSHSIDIIFSRRVTSKDFQTFKENLRNFYEIRNEIRDSCTLIKNL